MEKAHDISIDEPCVAHQAILFMLDVLMRNTKPTLSLADLYDSFGDKSFTPQMLRAVGGNEQGLKQFLSRYPSLFTVNGEQISANSGGNQLPRASTTPERYLRNKPSKSKTNTMNSSMTIGGASCDANGAEGAASDMLNSSLPSAGSSSNTLVSGLGGANGGSVADPGETSKTMKEIEQEAIAFFRKQISKREEDWLPIVSVAGHASQSSSDVRKFVGPQNEFKSFLLKYPHIFVVREEYCGLKGKADVSTQPFPPPSPPPKRRQQSTISMAVSMSNSTLGSNGGSNVSTLSRNHSFKQSNRYSTCNLLPNSGCSTMGNGNGLINVASSSSIMLNQSNASTPTSMMSTNSIANSLVSSVSLANSNAGMSKPRLTPVEVKAVHYVMRILHKNGRMLLQTIPGLISRAPDQVSNIVGFTREDLIQFFKRHSAIFQLHPDGCVSVKQDAVKALILKDAAAASNAAAAAAAASNGGGSVNGVGLSNGSGGLASQLSCSSMSLNNNSTPDCTGIITNNGVVLRIFPKYGILNMDNNEQVFFDIQSCQFETFSDLTTILHTGDRLHFNAVIGPRDGSTKWRSIKTWIKMKPQQQQQLQQQTQQQQSQMNNSNGGIISMLDNLSSHSDADKSDDSSTSSLGNNNNAMMTSSGRFNAFQAQQHQQYASFNGVNNTNQMASVNSIAGTGGAGSHYYLPNSVSSPPTPPSLIPVTSASTSGAVVVINGNGGIVNGPAVDGVAAAARSSNSSSSSSSSTSSENDNTLASTTNAPATSSGTASTVPHNGSGDFNQYQLDSSASPSSSSTSADSSATAATLSGGNNGESDSVSSQQQQSFLIHSSSANNLHINKQMNSTLVNSRSIHSFNTALANELNQHQHHHSLLSTKLPATIDEHSSKTGAAATTTKFMKQSPDNISQREVITKSIGPPTSVSPPSPSSSSSASSSSASSSDADEEKPSEKCSNVIELVSIGCQTISTGDVTVTNVYIE